MNDLKKFHCECGAPLNTRSGIIECVYCGNCYIYDGVDYANQNVAWCNSDEIINEMQSNFDNQKEEVGNELIKAYHKDYFDNSDNYPKIDTVEKPYDTLGYRCDSKYIDVNGNYRYDSQYNLDDYNTYPHPSVDQWLTKQHYGKAEKIDWVNIPVWGESRKYTWWDNIVELLTNTFDKIAKGFTIIW